MNRTKIMLASLVLLIFNPLLGYPTWDWSAIDLKQKDYFENLQFAKNFLWGVGDSDFQTAGQETEGGVLCQNNWTAYQIAHNKQPVGIATGRWSRWQKDIDLIKQSGFKAYRCSIEWSKVEPVEGQFNEAVLQHYVEQCKYAQAQGLQVWVALWHHTWPIWFGEKNAFEKSENIHYFISYATEVVQKLAPHVDKWITFNEPEGYTLGAYYVGNYPPEKKGNWQLAGEVLQNMLNAHVELYTEIKKINPTAQVGFTKIVELIDEYHTWNSSFILNYVAEVVPARFFNNLMNGAILEFFKTGSFVWYIPGKAKVTDTNKLAPDSLDFLGVNYYAHTKLSVTREGLKPTIKPAVAPDDIVSDGGRIIYPEGMYRAIELCARVGKPLYITENGIADADDRVRDMYIKKHLYAVKKAIDAGFDIRGYFYWTLLDCFEWKHEYTQSYGLYHVDFSNPELPRTLRSSSRNFVEFLQKLQGLSHV